MSLGVKVQPQPDAGAVVGRADELDASRLEGCNDQLDVGLCGDCEAALAFNAMYRTGTYRAMFSEICH